MTVTIRVDGLPKDDAATLNDLIMRMNRYAGKNKVAKSYHDGTQVVQNYGMSVPPALQSLKIAAGWSSTVVGSLEERLDFQGWTTPEGDDFGLGEIYRENALDLESSIGHTDALITGPGFIVVGKGAEGEPDVLITTESSSRVTGVWSRRLRRLIQAVTVNEVHPETKEPTYVSYHTLNTVYHLRRGPRGGWRIESTDTHNLNRVFVVLLPNRPSTDNPFGRSEITEAVRSYTDQAVRTLLGMEVNREFYSAPQRYLLGAESSMFEKADGSTATGWETVMGRMLAIPKDEDGEKPDIGQFSPASPAPYLEQVRGLSQLVAAEGALPASYLGFVTDNPTSADAIRQAEARLIKRAERRQITFGRAWREVAYLALLIKDGKVPENFSDLRVKWRDAATPTRSAAADEAVKLVGSGVLSADSEVTYDRIGLTPAEQLTLKADKRKTRALDTVKAIAEVTRPRQEPGASDDVKD